MTKSRNRVRAPDKPGKAGRAALGAGLLTPPPPRWARVSRPRPPPRWARVSRPRPLRAGRGSPDPAPLRAGRGSPDPAPPARVAQTPGWCLGAAGTRGRSLAPAHRSLAGPKRRPLLAARPGRIVHPGHPAILDCHGSRSTTTDRTMIRARARRRLRKD